MVASVSSVLHVWNSIVKRTAETAANSDPFARRSAVRAPRSWKLRLTISWAKRKRSRNGAKSSARLESERSRCRQVVRQRSWPRGRLFAERTRLALP